MKIEMGKKYQTKDGNPVRIDREHSDYCATNKPGDGLDMGELLWES